MRVYLAAAITNAARDLDTIRALLEWIEGEGYEVPTRHVADPAGREPEAIITDAGVAQRDLSWIAASDALVAEVSTPSHGVGIEVGEALARGIPVLLLYRAGTLVSRLLLGLPGAEVAAYSRIIEAGPLVSAFLARVDRARCASRPAH